MSHEPISRKVIAGVLIAIISPLILWLVPPLVGWIKAVSKATYNLAVYPVTLHLWVAAIGGVAAAAWLVVWLRSFRQSSAPAVTTDDYRSDVFAGMVWEWSYDAYGRIKTPTAFCPTDHTRLVSKTHSTWGPSYFYCETCDRTFASVPENHVEQLKRQIERKLRSGEWRSAVESCKLPPAS